MDENDLSIFVSNDMRSRHQVVNVIERAGPLGDEISQITHVSFSKISRKFLEK